MNWVVQAIAGVAQQSLRPEFNEGSCLLTAFMQTMVEVRCVLHVSLCGPALVTSVKRRTLVFKMLV